MIGQKRGRNEGCTSDGNKRQDQVGRASGDEMRESGGEHVGSIPHRGAALVDELQLLPFHSFWENKFTD